MDPDPQYGPPAFRPMATFFGIWHEFKRGAHFGLQEFYFSSNYILIINLFKENLEGFSSNKQSRTYEQFLPSDRYILNPGSFEGVALPVGADDVIAAKSAGISCDRVWLLFVRHTQEHLFIVTKVIKQQLQIHQDG